MVGSVFEDRIDSTCRAGLRSGIDLDASPSEVSLFKMLEPGDFMLKHVTLHVLHPSPQLLQASSHEVITFNCALGACARSARCGAASVSEHCFVV